MHFFKRLQERERVTSHISVRDEIHVLILKTCTHVFHDTQSFTMRASWAKRRKTARKIDLKFFRESAIHFMSFKFKTVLKKVKLFINKFISKSTESRKSFKIPEFLPVNFH